MPPAHRGRAEGGARAWTHLGRARAGEVIRPRHPDLHLRGLVIGYTMTPITSPSAMQGIISEQEGVPHQGICAEE